MHTATHRPIEPKVLYLGTPVLLLSTTNPGGSANLAPMSSAWWLTRTAVLGLSERSRTVENLRRTGEVVLNAVPSTLVDAVDRIALLTGSPEVPEYKAARGYRFEPDKFGVAGLTALASTVVAPPRVVECPIQMEATVRAIHPIGDPEARLCAVEVEVLAVHAADDVRVPGHDHHLDPETWDPLIMKFCEYYGGGANLRPSSLADGWQMPPLRAGLSAAPPAAADGRRPRGHRR